MNDKQAIMEAVERRVKWWLNDLAYKPPELLEGARGEWYYDCMAKDIALEAVGDDEGPNYAAMRLDPPRQSPPETAPVESRYKLSVVKDDAKALLRRGLKPLAVVTYLEDVYSFSTDDALAIVEGIVNVAGELTDS